MNLGKKSTIREYEGRIQALRPNIGRHRPVQINQPMKPTT